MFAPKRNVKEQEHRKQDKYGSSCSKAYPGTYSAFLIDPRGHDDKTKDDRPVPFSDVGKCSSNKKSD